MNSTKNILIVATMDTKGQEAAFMKGCLEKIGIPVTLLDAGIMGKSAISVDIRREQVAETGGKSLDDVRNIGHEGMALNAMAVGAVRIAEDLYGKGRIGGGLSLGGSMGTTIGTAVMRALPLGVPKVMVTTMASRDTRAFVGTSDILMLHAVCDLMGLNRITRKILHNGAAAIGGMVANTFDIPASEKPLMFLSTLGTTEFCAQRIRRHFEGTGKEVVLFHTVGSGGQAMEEMIYQENLTVVVDLSLHELSDHRFGGDYDAGPARGTAALQKEIPTVFVPGNIDFLVTGPVKSAKRRFPGRPYHQHNAAITAVNTSGEEMEILAQLLADNCNEAKGPWRILVPMGGFSAFDSEKGPLPDPEGRQRFLNKLQGALIDRSMLQVMDCHINDPEFADAVIAAAIQVMELA